MKLRRTGDQCLLAMWVCFQDPRAATLTSTYTVIKQRRASHDVGRARAHTSTSQQKFTWCYAQCFNWLRGSTFEGPSGISPSSLPWPTLRPSSSIHGHRRALPSLRKRPTAAAPTSIISHAPAGIPHPSLTVFSVKASRRFLEPPQLDKVRARR